MIRFEGIDKAGVRHQIRTWRPSPRRNQPKGVGICDTELVSVSAWDPGDREVCEVCMEKMGEK